MVTCSGWQLGSDWGEGRVEATVKLALGSSTLFIGASATVIVIVSLYFQLGPYRFILKPEYFALL